MSLSVNSHQPITRHSFSHPVLTPPPFSIEAHSSPLLLWEQAGFCNSEGLLTFEPDIQSQPLEAKARGKFITLLGKQVTIGKKQISFKDYLEKAQEAFPGYQLFLRGSYASFVIEPLQELKALIDAFISKHPETAEIMQEGYTRLLETVQPQDEPIDADWALIADIETLPDDLGPIKGKLIFVNAELGELDFFTAKNTTFANLNPARKNDLTLTEDPIVIASLKGSLDLLVGTPQVSPCLFSYDNRYIPFDIGKQPIALRGNYWQSTLDHALGLIRLEPRHQLDFRALLVALKHLSQGRTWISADFDFARVFNHFVENCSLDQLYNVIESKMPIDPPSSICYLMNVSSLIENNEALRNKLHPLIVARLEIPAEVECSFSQLANELYGFNRMPFLKKSIAPQNPDLTLFIKKTGLLHPERLPKPPQEGPYADWANETAALHQQNPLKPIPESIYEMLFILLERNALSEEERQTLQAELGWNEPLDAKHLLNRLVAVGNLKAFLPLWLNKHHHGDWENTLRRLFELVKIKPRKEWIKTYFESTLTSQPHPEELYLAAFSQHLFKPDADAKQLLQDSFNFVGEENLAHFLQSLAPLIRQKSWLTDLWIGFYLSGKLTPECLRKRISIWFSSNLSNDQKEALALDLFNRCEIDLFSDECAAHLIRHLQNPIDREKWLQSLFLAWPNDRFLRFVEALPETEISAGILNRELWKRLKENNLIGFIDLLTHEASLKRVQISSEDLAQPLHEALLVLSRDPNAQQIFIKHALRKAHKGLPTLLIQSLFEQVLAEPHLYPGELNTHKNWLIEQFKEEGEKLHRLFRYFPLEGICTTPPPSLILFLSSQEPDQIDLELSLSLMGLKGGESLYIPVLKGLIQSPSVAHFKNWLSQAFPRLKMHQRTEMLNLIQGRKIELLMLLQYLIDQPLKNPHPFADRVVDALLSLPNIMETIDLKVLKKLAGHTGKPLQRFFETPHLFTRLVKEYLFLKPVHQELLELSMIQAETFNLLHLFIAEAPWLRRLPLQRGSAYTQLRRVGVESYIFQATGSHEWLFEMSGMCDHPIVNQLSIIRLVNQGIDFHRDDEARAFLYNRINDIMQLRHKQGIAWVNYRTIGECLAKIFSYPLIEAERNLPEGLFEWFTAIGIDQMQTVSCRSNMLQIAVLHGSPQISETALLHLFDLLPEMTEIDFQLLEGLIFSISLNPHLATKPLRDKLNQVMEEGPSSAINRIMVLSHLLDLILLNRLNEHDEERLNCSLLLFREACEAQIDLLQPTYANQIIKCIGLNFFTPQGKALLIKDEWIKAVNSTHPHIPPIQNKLKCVTQLNEQIFNYATENSFSGILVMVSQEVVSLIQALKGGYEQTHPLLQRLLEQSTSHQHFTHSTIQAETLIPLLPHLKIPSLIYFYLLLLMRKNLEMPPGEYLKYLKIHDEIKLIHHALDVHLLRGDDTAAEAAKRIYLFSLKKKMSFSIRLNCFEKVIQTYSKAHKSLDAGLDLVVETFRRLEKPLDEKQRSKFIQIIEPLRPEK